MLKDYPEHIQTLQADLNRVVEKPSKGIPLSEQAIWALEAALSTFAVDAREETKAAEAGGDPAAIAQAKAKERLMFQASSSNGGMRLGLMNDLWDYFKLIEGV
ncbi:TPA: hypothetical protein UN269_000948 [Stenotrophomonas maltophilia]|nr:hypothetical protein [Stenotrophomonas maltophilia]